MLVLQLVNASAQYASIPQDLLFEDLLSPFSGVGIDTGFLPDPGDPISVRFHITPSGGIFTELEAISNLRWPTAFEHSIQAVPGEGFFGIDVDLEVEFEVKIDVGGIFQDTIPVWTENFGVHQVVPFDTLVLPGSPEYPLQASASGNLLDPFTYDISIISGVALELAVQLEPEVSATLAGVAIESANGGVVGVQDEEEGFGQLPAPNGNPGQALLASTYVADLTSQVILNIVPSATLDTFIGDLHLVTFDLPVQLLDLSEERRFDPVVVVHPLPAMEPFELEGFAPVGVGNLANANVTLTNLGILGLEGTARIEGNESFTVFPESFYAGDAQSDGVVVTFAPQSVGTFGATLVIESNDPVSPELRIPLSGSGVDLTPTPLPPTPPPTPNDPPTPPGVNSEDIKGCGCSSPGAMGSMLLPLVSLFWMRRC